MTDRTRIVIVSATSSIAEHCARIWVLEKNVELILIGRNVQKLQSIADDLQTRGPQAEIKVVEANFTDPKAIASLVDTIAKEGKIDRILIAQGILPKQEDCQQNLTVCYDTLLIDAISPVLFAEAFIGHLEKNNHGTLAIIGSIAGDRGLRSMYTYGSAKALLEHYVQGLQHRLARSNVKVVLIKPGPTDTALAIPLKERGMKLASVDKVAADCVHAIANGKTPVYTPAKWRFIMGLLRYLPNFVFNKLDI